MDLTDVRWERLAPIFEKPYAGTGRLRQDARLALNGVLWILRTGASWKDMPRRYPPYQILRFLHWRVWRFLSSKPSNTFTVRRTELNL